MDNNKVKYMKAAICTKYGDYSGLTYIDVLVPQIKKDEILIKTDTATVSAGDNRIFNLNNLLMKLIFGFNRPRRPILGSEFSGTVVAVGKAVVAFKKGDEVFGSKDAAFGGHAEYIRIKEKSAVQHIPDNLALSDCAALAFGGCTALSFLDKAKITTDCRILIYGASGSVGSAAVQLATYLGAEVTGVCSSRNVEMVYQLGAVSVYDYQSIEYKNYIDEFDVIFDAVGKMKQQDRKRIRSKKFLNVMNGLSLETKEKLSIIKDAVMQEKFKPVIDSVYNFDELEKAYKLVGSGRKKGNVLVRIAESKM